ncbi:MAG: YhfT family protein [Ktedonobacteraceae bacterium]
MTLAFSPFVSIVIILTTAYTALLSQMALAVFNDGTRPFLLDFHRGELSRVQMATIAFKLSASFIFGFGIPLTFSSGIFNPWLLFLPTDVLGLLAPKRWLALLLGAVWGAIVICGLSVAITVVNSLPVNFLLAMQQMATPILFLFAFFPVVAITTQFGRPQGAIAFIISLIVMFITLQWLSLVFAESLALASGMLILVMLVMVEEIHSKQEANAEIAMTNTLHVASVANARRDVVEGRDKSVPTKEVNAVDDEVAVLFAANASYLRKHTPYFILMGILLGVLANTHTFSGGEGTGFVLAQRHYINAAQIDFYRALGFVPLVVTTAIASGSFQTVGFMLVYSIAYLLPNPMLAGIAGGVLFRVEILPLISLYKALSGLHAVHDASDNIRHAMHFTLEIALLYGAITSGNAMAGGVGIVLVASTYILNEILGRPIVRMTAGLVGVILAGILLNVLVYIHLFTPSAMK